MISGDWSSDVCSSDLLLLSRRIGEIDLCPSTIALNWSPSSVRIVCKLSSSISSRSNGLLDTDLSPRRFSDTMSNTCREWHLFPNFLRDPSPPVSPPEMGCSSMERPRSLARFGHTRVDAFSFSGIPLIFLNFSISWAILSCLLRDSSPFLLRAMLASLRGVVGPPVPKKL